MTLTQFSFSPFWVRRHWRTFCIKSKIYGILGICNTSLAWSCICIWIKSKGLECNYKLIFPASNPSNSYRAANYDHHTHRANEKIPHKNNHWRQQKGRGYWRANKPKQWEVPKIRTVLKPVLLNLNSEIISAEEEPLHLACYALI